MKKLVEIPQIFSGKAPEREERIHDEIVVDAYGDEEVILSWYYYLHPDELGLNSVRDIITNPQFAAFGPYDDHVISAFWSLNVFLHQRHLGFAFMLLGLVFVLLNLKHTRARKGLAILLTLLLSWTNQAVLFILFILLGLNIIEHYLHKKNWAQLMFFVSTCVAVSLTAVTFISSRALGTGSAFNYKPGFIYYGTTWNEFPFIEGELLQWTMYWLLNTGILPVLAILGFVFVAPWKKPSNTNIRQRVKDISLQVLRIERLPFVSAVIIFIIANLFIFAVDPSTNHKFINYVIVVGSIYAAVFLAKLLTIKRFPAFVILLIAVTLGGVFDLFPVLNTPRHHLDDIEASETAIWIRDNTARDTTFLNITSDFNPVMSTGRKLFFGPQYINWSLGYPTVERLEVMRSITRGSYAISDMCLLAEQYDMQYIYLTEHPTEYLETPKDLRFFDNNFRLEYASEDNYYRIYDLTERCDLL